MSTEFTGVPADRIDDYWPHVSGLIENIAGRSGRRFSAQDYYESFKDRGRQLWVAVTDGDVVMALITEIRTYPGKRVAALVACAGERRGDWLHYLTTVEKWAKAQGCEAIEAEARPGWERVLGWRRTHVILEKEI